MNDVMLSRLKQLKLSGIIKSFETRNEQAIKENLSYIEFFELLLSDEISNRQNNSIKKRMNKAKFPQIKTLEEYQFNFQPSINKKDIYNLATCEFVRKKENIVFIGPPGTGKTHLAIALGIKAVSQGYRVLFTTVNEMLKELYLSRADNSFSQKLKHYTTPELLILDELGLKKLNQNSVCLLYTSPSPRDRQKSRMPSSA